MKKIIIFILFAILMASCVNVKSSGFKTAENVDDTEFIQNLLNGNNEKIVVPARDTPWIVRPLFIKNAENKIFIFESGCHILAKKGEFKGKGDTLITVRNCKNIKLIGYGAILSMNKYDYWGADYAKSEWRDGLDIHETENALIEGFKIKQTGGDGVYIGQASDEVACKNITLKNLVIEDNHRQGVSVISVDGLLMENCSVFGTNGTMPKAGIDFEPNLAKNIFNRVLVKNCSFQYNKGSGIHIFLRYLDKTSHPVDITVENCFLAYNGFGLSIMSVPKGVTGKIRFINTEIKGAQWITAPKGFDVLSE